MSALEKALNQSKNLGIDECEIIVVKKKITTIRITDSEIAEIKENFDESYGIRLIHDKKIASIQTTNQQDIEKSIEDAFQTSSNLKSREFWKGLPHKVVNKRLDGTFDEKLEKISGQKAMDIAQTMINSANDHKITTITGSLNIVSENFELGNSNGLSLIDKATYISGILNAESEEGSLPVSGIGHACGRTLSSFSAEQVGEDAKTMCIASINPQKIDSDKYSIIFEPYSVGELLAFVIASNFSFKIFSEKKSCFSNNFEDKIAIEELDLVDDPHVPEGIGTKSVDDEGIETQRKKLIEKGVFKNTFANLFDSVQRRKRIQQEMHQGQDLQWVEAQNQFHFLHHTISK